MTVIFLAGFISLFVIALLIDIISRKLYYVSQFVHSLPSDSSHRLIVEYEQKTISPLLFLLGSVLPILLVNFTALIGLDYFLGKLEANTESIFVNIHYGFVCLRYSWRL